MSTPPLPPQEPLSDEALLAGIRQAVIQGLEPEDVERAVGKRAWINTTRPNERFALHTANIGPDADTGESLPGLCEARDVVYWGRPVDAHDPRIAGILWQRDAGPQMFFGILYPP